MRRGSCPPVGVPGRRRREDPRRQPRSNRIASGRTLAGNRWPRRARRQDRLRAAVVASDGRVARLDLPLEAGLRASGAVLARIPSSGSAGGRRVAPRARTTQGDLWRRAAREPSSAEPLTGTAGVLELTRAGTAQPAVRQTLELRAQTPECRHRCCAGAARSPGVAPGTYMASAVLDSAAHAIRANQPSGRSRARRGDDGSGACRWNHGAASLEDWCNPRPGARRCAAARRALRGELRRAGVAPRRRRVLRAAISERSRRRAGDCKLLAEFALFKTNDATGWVGFRDVIEVDGKPIPDRRD